MKAVKKVNDINDVKIVDVLTWRTDMDQPEEETIITSLVNAIKSTAADDDEALRTALSQTLTAETSEVSAGRRIADRSLAQNLSGEQATDDDIENGVFNVTAKIDGQDWWVFLDMEPADIVPIEKGS
ncbi:MAG: hypothetical protein GY869_06260 [Planctomycetes bacterium]|nr:hypothetical protein [Planctomycetota bacterium]